MLDNGDVSIDSTVHSATKTVSEERGTLIDSASDVCATGKAAVASKGSVWKNVSLALCIVSVLLGVGIGLAFDAGRKEGLGIGKKTGLDEGEKSGFERGFREGELLGLETGKSIGFDDGKTDGLQEGKKQGYAKGFAAGSRSGRNSEVENSKDNFGPALVVHHLQFARGEKIAQVVIFNNTPWDYHEAKIGLNVSGSEGGYWYRMPKFESGESLKLGCANFKSLNGAVFPSGSVCVSSEFRGLLDGRPISKQGLVYE